MMSFNPLDDINRLKVVLTCACIKKDLDNQVEVNISEPSEDGAEISVNFRLPSRKVMQVTMPVIDALTHLEAMQAGIKLAKLAKPVSTSRR